MAWCGADAEEYEWFLAILWTHSKGDIKEVYACVVELFKDHPNLLSEFAHFLPTWVSEPSPTPSPTPRTSSSDVEVEGQAPPTPMLVDEVAVASDLSGDDGDISLDESDQEFVDDSEQPTMDHATTTLATVEIEVWNAEEQAWATTKWMDMDEVSALCSPVLCSALPCAIVLSPQPTLPPC
eukprot:COSAG06_NODE_12888_length_1316_cov_1.458505_2_plen_181_part_00